MAYKTELCHPVHSTFEALVVLRAFGHLCGEELAHSVY